MITLVFYCMINITISIYLCRNYIIMNSLDVSDRLYCYTVTSSILYNTKLLSFEWFYFNICFHSRRGSASDNKYLQTFEQWSGHVFKESDKTYKVVNASGEISATCVKYLGIFFSYLQFIYFRAIRYFLKHISFPFDIIG